MRMTYRLIAVLGFGLLSCSAGPEEPEHTDSTPPSQGGTTNNEVVAKVNGGPVYRVFYNQNLNFIRDKIQATRGEGAVEAYISAKFEALENLVDDELIYQEAKRQGVRVTEDQVEAEFQRIAAREGGEEAFLAKMATAQMNRNQILQGVRRRMTNDEFVKEGVTAGLEASDEEAEAYYNAHHSLFSTELWFKVSHILIRCKRQAGSNESEEARLRAEKILANVRGGRSFEHMAREFSEDSTSVLNGEIGYMKKGTTYPEFEEVAFKLSPGEVSDVVRTDAGFHIIKVTGRRGGALQEFSEVRDVCRKGVLRDKSAAAVRDLLEYLRKSAEIETFLK